LAFLKASATPRDFTSIFVSSKLSMIIFWLTSLSFKALPLKMSYDPRRVVPGNGCWAQFLFGIGH